MTSLINRVEYLDDRVRIEYLPYDLGGTLKFMEVLYKDIPGLPLAPPLRTRENWEDSVFDIWYETVPVPQCNATIGFEGSEFQETSFQTMNALCDQPYLMPQPAT